MSRHDVPIFHEPVPSCDARPVVVDGEVVWLPTLVGLLRGTPPITPAQARATLRTSLTAAVATDEVIAEYEAEFRAT